jgi:hypothetical protein
MWRSVVAPENNLLRAGLYIYIFFLTIFLLDAALAEVRFVLWISDSSGQHQCLRLKIFMRTFALQFNVSIDNSLLLTTYFVT